MHLIAQGLNPRNWQVSSFRQVSLIW